MAAFLNPVPGFQALAEMFRAGADKKAGIRVSPDLCGLIADALVEGAEHVSVLVEFARAHDRVDTIEPQTAATRTPVQRQQLARLAIALDPGARIVAFPQAPIRTFAASEGGTAA